MYQQNIIVSYISECVIQTHARVGILCYRDTTYDIVTQISEPRRYTVDMYVPIAAKVHLILKTCSVIAIHMANYGPSFTKIPPLSTEISRYAESDGTGVNRQRTDGHQTDDPKSQSSRRLSLGARG